MKGKEILFRAKTKNGIWKEGLPFYGADGCIDGIETVAGYVHYIDNTTLSQYICHKDKRGDKIFEGDVVKMWYDDFDEPEYLTVYYDENLCSYLCRSNQSSMRVECDLLHDGEIVGNIFDNPKLSEGEDDTVNY